MIKIIGITGTKNSGKSTSSELITELMNGQCQEIQIAKKLKDACQEVFSLDRKFLYDPKLKDKELQKPIFLEKSNIYPLFNYFGIKEGQLDYDKFVRPHIGKICLTPRELLQYCGSQILRKYDNDILVSSILPDLSTEKLNIISDVRLKHEYVFLKNRFRMTFECFYIERFRMPRLEHETEKEVLDIAKLVKKVDNKGSILELKDLWSIELKFLKIIS